ncbi:MAG TPA: VOC family protein [Planctomicrobium sp.]|nr:VOC family protein [Planctomicrobium sp.]
MKPQAVKYVLMVQDMDRAVRFYRDTMGFTEGSLSSYWSELRFGDAILGLHYGGDGSRHQTAISIQYANVAAAYAMAIKSGAEGVQAPVQREGEPILFSSVVDPEGNIITLTQFVGEDAFEVEKHPLNS